MKKLKRILAVVLLAGVAIFPADTIQSYDFEENEDYYRTLCASPTSNREDQNACIEFQQYLKDKISNLENEITDLQFNIESAKEDLAKFDEEISKYEDLIAQNESEIADSESKITALNEQIEEKEKNIEKRYQIVVDRMLEEQPTLGTNMYIDFIMGAKDLVDMIRIMEGINRITENDRLLLEELQKEKEDLEFDRNEVNRIKEEQELRLEENQALLVNAEKLKEQQTAAIEEFQRQEAELTAAKRKIPDPSQVQGNVLIPPVDENGNVDIPDFDGNTGFIRPVANSYISHGTWAYNSGGLHLGVDYAANNGSPIYAPADALVVATYDACGNTGASACGLVWGTGNMVHLITQSNGTTYAMSFFHMYPGSVAVRPSIEPIKQGQQIGAVGNSGNSYGSHCHVEVFNLGTMSVAEAAEKFKQNLDLSWGAGWSTAGAWPRIRPETVFP